MVIKDDGREYLDLLIRIDERVNIMAKNMEEMMRKLDEYAHNTIRIETKLNNHLENHKRTTKIFISLMSALSAIISAIISYILGR